MTYPVLLAIGVPWILVAANRVTSRLGAASIVVLLLMGRDVLFQLFVPWAVHTGTAADQSWDSGRLPIGATFSQTFADPGVYEFLCTIHPAMKGTITVNG